MELLIEDEEILARRCNRDAVLRYLMTHAPCTRQALLLLAADEGLGASAMGRVDWAAVLAALEGREGDAGMPPPLSSLLRVDLGSNDSLLRSMVFARVQQVCKLDLLEAEIRMQTGPQPQRQTSAVKLKLPVQLERKLSLSAFDPLGKAAPRDLMWFSPAKQQRKAAVTLPLGQMPTPPRRRVDQRRSVAPMPAFAMAHADYSAAPASAHAPER